MPGSDTGKDVKADNTKPGDKGKLENPDQPKKTKKILVCGCTPPRQVKRCADCKQGYVDRALAGELPHSQVVEVVQKRVPCCACKKQLGTCPTCNQGYMTLLEAGETPHFMFIDVEDQEGKNDSQPKAPEAVTAETEEEKKKRELEGRIAYN